MKRHYIIYTYKDPRNDNIFYVGQSINGMKRAQAFSQHNVWCRRVIAKIEASGMHVEIEITDELEKTRDVRNELNVAEKARCAAIQNEGHHLTNLLFGENMNRPHLYETERKAHGNKGKVRTAEHRKNMSKAQTGRKASPETKKKMSQAHLGRKKSEAHKKAMRDNWYEKRGPEVFEKIAASKRGKPRSEETKAKISASGKQGALKGWETRRRNAEAKTIPG